LTERVDRSKDKDSLMTILDRYVLQKFFMPFLYCFVGFLAIWFIFDLADNLSDFLEGRVTLDVVIEYYLSQLPEIIIMSIPIGTLLALLYSLTSMSRSNELISMLGAGRSVIRVLAPLFFVSVILALITAYFNFESAPHAAATKKQMLRDIKRGEQTDESLTGHLFRNREDLRTWFMRKLWLGSGRLTQVQIIQQDEDHNIVEEWFANEARFDPVNNEWELFAARHIVMDEKGDIVDSVMRTHLTIPGWSETPWRISSSVMNPDFLSVRELREYLYHNSDFPDNRLAAYRTHLHYRFALPLVCILVVLLAAPMGIVYSRRGILTGVASAIALFFLLVFLSSLFIAFGKGAKMPPVIAAWGPLVIFTIIGLYLLWCRSTNREIRFPRIPGIS